MSRHQPALTVEASTWTGRSNETVLLGLLCQASGPRRRVAGCKKAAGERQVMSFGARRTDPGLAPTTGRDAFVGAATAWE